MKSTLEFKQKGLIFLHSISHTQSDITLNHIHSAHYFITGTLFSSTQYFEPVPNYFASYKPSMNIISKVTLNIHMLSKTPLTTLCIWSIFSSYTSCGKSFY